MRSINSRWLILLLLWPIVCDAQNQGTTFENRCSICHGGDGNGGGRAPSILPFVRYHTDTELSALILGGRIEKGMPAFQLPAEELKNLLSAIRHLTGTNPNMAMGGLTGEGLKIHARRKPEFDSRKVDVLLQNGSQLSGTIVNQDDFSAQMLTSDNQYHFLSRDGNHYIDRPVQPKKNWLSYNGDTTGNRYSTLEQINTGNVQRLALDWLFTIPNSPRLETTPVVADGVMYVTSWNELYALDATTGQQLWMYRQPRTEGLLSDAGKGANRGAAISGGQVLMITDNAHLLAFDRIKGDKLWDVKMDETKDGYSATGAPLVIGDLVIVGVAGGEEGARGFLDAYRISDGQHAWRFYTIPKRGEKAAETWVGSALEHGCGATWLTGSFDPALDLVYWQVGNPCPDFNGDERKGDNLYTDSVVALSAKTGELRWHFQFTPHDLHDWDSEQSILLLDQNWRGQPRKLLVHADRNGFFFVLDRVTGELLLAEPFVKVNWATGYGKDGRPILTDNFETTREGTLTCPASSGGTNWPSHSWSPVTRLFYLRSSDWCALFKKQDDPLVENRWYGGIAPNQPGAKNFIRALDISTGKKVWEFPLSAGGKGGLLATGGGLVFLGGAQGYFVALDAFSGKHLWHVAVGQDWQSSPMTFMVGGKQYVTVTAQGGVFTFALRE